MQDERTRRKWHVGTSGWCYAHWTRGRFYPEKMKQSEWLPYYASQFETVEVNTSFYHLPRPTLIEGWRERAPKDFEFCLKMWRRVTHIKKLLWTGEDLKIFFEIASLLEPKQRGPILVQLPPSLKRNDQRLALFFDHLRENIGQYPWKVAVEFRNSTWYCPEVNQVLDANQAALCLHDFGNCSINEPNNASWVYIRRHGGSGNYQGLYNEEQIARDADLVRQIAKQGREVYVYYNNDVEGYAVDNARQLIERLEA